MEVKPYSNDKGTKKEQVIRMFNQIAPRYDFLNRILSFGIDKIWRKRLVKLAARSKASVILDVATGTGDLALALTKNEPAIIYAVDISTKMLQLAEKKVQKKNLQNTIILKEADSESLPFENNTFDLITVAFGVRNFENYLEGLKEMKRVLKPGGMVLILEFSNPELFPIKQLYNFYFHRIIPLFAACFSSDKEAYNYLPASVVKFPEGQSFENKLLDLGFKDTISYKQTLGVATIYSAKKNLQ